MRIICTPHIVSIQYIDLCKMKCAQPMKMHKLGDVDKKFKSGQITSHYNASWFLVFAACRARAAMLVRHQKSSFEKEITKIQHHHGRRKKIF